MVPFSKDMPPFRNRRMPENQINSGQSSIDFGDHVEIMPAKLDQYTIFRMITIVFLELPATVKPW